MDAGAITATVPPPGWWVVVATGVVALLVTASALVPRITRSRRAMFRVNVLGTLVHEAGHAAVSCLTGGGVYRIEIYTPDSGRTSTWYPSRFSAIATGAVGYAAPPLAGLGAASLLHRGHAPAVLALRSRRWFSSCSWLGT